MKKNTQINQKKLQGKRNRASGARFELNKYIEANIKRWSNPEYKKKVGNSISISLKGRESPMKGKNHTEKTKEKIRKSDYHKNFGRTGKENYNWKGDEAKYGSIHGWVNKNFKIPKFCSGCGTDKKKLEWSNKDHKYSRLRKDWQFVCRNCHRRYDNEKFREK